MTGLDYGSAGRATREPDIKVALAALPDAMFKSRAPLAEPLKLVYCASCQHVSLKTRYERDRCERCLKEARLVRVPYPWQRVAGTGVILAGAVFLILPQAANGIPWAGLTSTLALRIAWLSVFVGIGLYLSTWGLRIMKAAALARGRELTEASA